MCMRHQDKVTIATDLVASLDEMVQTATNTFYNREQEREAKAQERKRRKETRYAQMLAALQGSHMAHCKSLKDITREVPTSVYFSGDNHSDVERAAGVNIGILPSFVLSGCVFPLMLSDH